MTARRWDFMRPAALLLVICASITLTSGCGGGGSSAHVSVMINPSSAMVPAGQSQQFTATVSGSTNQSATWSVNQITGGNATVGTISTNGLYTAVPRQNVVHPQNE
jgi:hypothetical protein